MYNDEPPRVRWHEIMTLAERLGSGPSLVPVDIKNRMQMVSIVSELADEGGLVWQARMGMLHAGYKAQGDAVLRTPMFVEYGYTQEAFEASLIRMNDIIGMLTDQVHAQRKTGSQYLVGDSLTAADLYWAFFSQPFRVSGPEINPMNETTRAMWEAGGKQWANLDAALFEQRDFIFDKHIKTPMEF